MIECAKKLLRDEEAPTAVEYALMVGGVALVIIGAVWFFGSTISNSFTDSTDKMFTGR